MRESRLVKFISVKSILLAGLLAILAFVIISPPALEPQLEKVIVFFQARYGYDIAVLVWQVKRAKWFFRFAIGIIIAAGIFLAVGFRRSRAKSEKVWDELSGVIADIKAEDVDKTAGSPVSRKEEVSVKRVPITIRLLDDERAAEFAHEIVEIYNASHAKKITKEELLGQWYVGKRKIMARWNHSLVAVTEEEVFPGYALERVVGYALNYERKKEEFPQGIVLGNSLYIGIVDVLDDYKGKSEVRSAVWKELIKESIQQFNKRGFIEIGNPTDPIIVTIRIRVGDEVEFNVIREIVEDELGFNWVGQEPSDERTYYIYQWGHKNWGLDIRKEHKRHEMRFLTKLLRFVLVAVSLVVLPPLLHDVIGRLISLTAPYIAPVIFDIKVYVMPIISNVKIWLKELDMVYKYILGGLVLLGVSCIVPCLFRRILRLSKSKDLYITDVGNGQNRNSASSSLRWVGLARGMVSRIAESRAKSDMPVRMARNRQRALGAINPKYFVRYRGPAGPKRGMRIFYPLNKAGVAKSKAIKSSPIKERDSGLQSRIVDTVYMPARGVGVVRRNKRIEQTGVYNIVQEKIGEIDFIRRYSCALSDEELGILLGRRTGQRVPADRIASKKEWIRVPKISFSVRAFEVKRQARVILYMYRRGLRRVVTGDFTGAVKIWENVLAVDTNMPYLRQKIRLVKKAKSSTLLRDQLLALLFQRGYEQAAMAIIEVNKGFIIKYARSLYPAMTRQGRSLRQLEDFALYGAKIAVLYYDPYRGVKFNTFMRPFVQQEINKGIAASGGRVDIKLKNKTYGKYVMFCKWVNEVGYVPAIDETVKKLNVRRDTAEMFIRIWNVYNKEELSKERDMFSSDDLDRSLNSHEQNSYRLLLQREVWQALSNLDVSPLHREMFIELIKNEGSDVTPGFADVGRQHGINRKTVGWIYNRVLGALRVNLGVVSVGMYRDIINSVIDASSVELSASDIVTLVARRLNISNYLARCEMFELLGFKFFTLHFGLNQSRLICVPPFKKWHAFRPRIIREDNDVVWFGANLVAVEIVKVNGNNGRGVVQHDLDRLNALHVLVHGNGDGQSLDFNHEFDAYLQQSGLSIFKNHNLSPYAARIIQRSCAALANSYLPHESSSPLSRENGFNKLVKWLSSLFTHSPPQKNFMNRLLFLLPEIFFLSLTYIYTAKQSVSSARYGSSSGIRLALMDVFPRVKNVSSSALRVVKEERLRKIKEFVVLYGSVITDSELAGELGMKVSSLRQWARKNGVRLADYNVISSKKVSHMAKSAKEKVHFLTKEEAVCKYYMFNIMLRHIGLLELTAWHKNWKEKNKTEKPEAGMDAKDKDSYPPISYPSIIDKICQDFSLEERRELVRKGFGKISQLLTKVNDSLSLTDKEYLWIEETRNSLGKAVTALILDNKVAANGALAGVLLRLGGVLNCLSEQKRLRKPRKRYSRGKGGHKLRLGRFVNFEAMPGALVPVILYEARTSESRWQAMQSIDRAFDSEFDELDYINEYLSYIADMRDKLGRAKVDFKLDRQMQEQFPQGLMGIAQELNPRWITDKVFAKITLTLVAGLIVILRYDYAHSFLGLTQSFLQRRKDECEDIIAGLKNGVQQDMRKDIWEETGKMCDDIERAGRSKTPVLAWNMSRRKIFRNEPEFAKIMPVLFGWLAAEKKKEPADPKVIDRILRYLRRRMTDVRLGFEFMIRFRTAYERIRLEGRTIRSRDDFFNQEYEQFAKKNNIVRGSPSLRILCCQAARPISFKIKNPNNHKSEIINLAFRLASCCELLQHIRFLNFQRMPGLSQEKYGNARGLLKEFVGQGKPYLYMLTPDEREMIFNALTEDIYKTILDRILFVEQEPMLRQALRYFLNPGLADYSLVHDAEIPDNVLQEIRTQAAKSFNLLNKRVPADIWQARKNINEINLKFFFHLKGKDLSTETISRKLELFQEYLNGPKRQVREAQRLAQEVIKQINKMLSDRKKAEQAYKIAKKSKRVSASSINATKTNPRGLLVSSAVSGVGGTLLKIIKFMNKSDEEFAAIARVDPAVIAGLRKAEQLDREDETRILLTLIVVLGVSADVKTFEDILVWLEKEKDRVKTERAKESVLYAARMNMGDKGRPYREVISLIRPFVGKYPESFRLRAFIGGSEATLVSLEDAVDTELVENNEMVIALSFGNTRDKGVDKLYETILLFRDIARAISAEIIRIYRPGNIHAIVRRVILAEAEKICDARFSGLPEALDAFNHKVHHRGNPEAVKAMIGLVCYLKHIVYSSIDTAEQSFSQADEAAALASLYQLIPRRPEQSHDAIRVCVELIDVFLENISAIGVK
ncbi:MAG: hypothetical protein ABH858_07025, partial [Candidatus Omnitrophota bacterium]